jgi:hypothetical protein
MKKIQINQKEIFEIAYLIKQKIPYQKVYLCLSNRKVSIKIRDKKNKLEIKELESFLKLKYPHLDFFIKIS